MNKLLTLAVTAAAMLAGAAPASAGGQTVCVFRNRPVAINPSPRLVVGVPSVRYRSPQYFAYRSAANYSGGFYNNYYGGIYNRPYSGYGVPCRTVNGYVGGLANLPHIVIQIPHTFGKPAQVYHRGPVYNGGGGRPSHGGGRPSGGGGGRPSGGGAGGGGGGSRR